MVDLRVRYANSVGGGAFGASKRGAVVTVEFGGGGGGGRSSVDVVEPGDDCGPEEGGVWEDGDTIVAMLYQCLGCGKNVD